MNTNKSADADEVDDERWTIRERLADVAQKIWREISFSLYTYPRELRNSGGIFRPTRRYSLRTALARRRYRPDHHEAFGALGRWATVWGKLSPTDDDHLDPDMTCLLPFADPSCQEDLDKETGRTFLTAVLASMVDPGEKLLVFTRSYSFADGTPPKPLRGLAFLNQAYWGSVSSTIDDPGECRLGHLFVSWITIGSADFARLSRIVVNDEAAGVCLLPKDLRWMAWLCDVGLDVRTSRQADLVAFEDAARAGGGHAVRRGAEPPPYGQERLE